METSVIDTVAKYFYFSSLDEQLSFTASLKALSELKSKGWLAERSRWVQILSKWKPQLKQLRGRAWPEFKTQRGFAFAAGCPLLGVPIGGCRGSDLDRPRGASSAY